MTGHLKVIFLRSLMLTKVLSRIPICQVARQPCNLYWSAPSLCNKNNFISQFNLHFNQENNSIIPISFLMPFSRLLPCPHTGNNYCDFYHCRFVLPVLELHIYGIILMSSLCLTSFVQLNIFEIHPVCCFCQWLISFYCWITFYFIDTLSQIVYPFSCWWTFALLPVCGYYE